MLYLRFFIFRKVHYWRLFQLSASSSGSSGASAQTFWSAAAKALPSRCLSLCCSLTCFLRSLRFDVILVASGWRHGSYRTCSFSVRWCLRCPLGATVSSCCRLSPLQGHPNPNTSALSSVGSTGWSGTVSCSPLVPHSSWLQDAALIW